MSFDPNDKFKPKVPQWASYVPSRRPNFKVHTNVGQAKNALNYHGNGIIYELVEGEWVEWDKHPTWDHCAHCGKPTPKNSWRGQFVLHKHPAKPAYNQPRVCEECYYKHFAYRATDPIPHDWCGKVERIDG